MKTSHWRTRMSPEDRGRLDAVALLSGRSVLPFLSKVNNCAVLTGDDTQLVHMLAAVNEIAADGAVDGIGLARSYELMSDRVVRAAMTAAGW